MAGMSNYLRKLWNRPNYAVIVLIVKKGDICLGMPLFLHSARKGATLRAWARCFCEALAEQPEGRPCWQAVRCVRASSRRGTEPLLHSEGNTRWHPEQRCQPRHQQCPHGPTFDSTSPASLGRSSSRAKIHAAKMAGPSKWQGPRNGRALAATKWALGQGEGGTPGSPGPFQPSLGLRASRRCRSLNACCRHHAPLPPGRALEHKERAPLNDAGSFQKSRGFAPACFFFSRLPA